MPKLLKPFGMKSKQVWADGGNRRGYVRDQFKDAWARYLADPRGIYRKKTAA